LVINLWHSELKAEIIMMNDLYDLGAELLLHWSAKK
jgi:hypothetical protein